MNAVVFLEKQIPRFLAVEILSPSLVVFPLGGASAKDIKAEEIQIGLSFSAAYRRFLHQWNGFNLDVIRFFGVGNVSAGIRRISEQQDIFDDSVSFLFIASDPAGFAFAENREGHIYSFDHDGGEIELICEGFDAFVIDYLFGKDSLEFLGEKWLENINALG